MHMKYWPAVAGLLPLLCLPAYAGDATFIASGTGKIVVKPDLVLVSINFTSDGKTPELALEGDAKTATAIIKAMTDAGVEGRDLQTQAYTIHETQGPDGCGEYHDGVDYVPCVKDGYEISNSMTVRIRHLEKYGHVLEAAIHAGLTDISNITLAVADPKSFKDQAYTAALLDAKHKAELTAQTLGFKLGPILDVGANIERYGDDDDRGPATLADGIVYPPPDGEADLMTVTPIQAGELTFTKQASITYQIIQEQ